MRPGQFRDSGDVENELTRYCELAIRLGASDAKTIGADQIIVERRVSAKCAIPKCSGYGTCANCPPYAPSPLEVREIVKEYKYAIFVRLKLPPEELTDSSGNPEAKKANPPKILETVSGVEPLKAPNRPRDATPKIFEIVSGVESKAFYDGHYLAMGFGGGSCRRALCGLNACSVLMPGGSCRHALKSRPSMEAVGMDAFRMAVNVGWDIYPMGKATCPADVPHGSRLGLVLIF